MADSSLSARITAALVAWRWVLLVVATGIAAAAFSRSGDLSFDRSIEPAKGPAPEVALPDIWTHTYANGLRVFGIEHDELPLVQFGLTDDEIEDVWERIEDLIEDVDEGDIAVF